jgi:hypothetical protein
MTFLRTPAGTEPKRHDPGHHCPVRNLRLVLVPIAACLVAGCGSTSADRTAAPTSQVQRIPQTTLPPPTTAGSGVAPPACANGTVTVTAAPGGQATPVCATVGSRIVLRGGNDGSGGTWPGPAQISDTSVVAMVSSHSAGTSFTAQLRALATGTASVTVPFVAGNDVCDPTPCTPIPGAPLQFAVRVVS